MDVNVAIIPRAIFVSVSAGDSNSVDVLRLVDSNYHDVTEQIEEGYCRSVSYSTNFLCIGYCLYLLACDNSNFLWPSIPYNFPTVDASSRHLRLLCIYETLKSCTFDIVLSPTPLSTQQECRRSRNTPTLSFGLRSKRNIAERQRRRAWPMVGAQSQLLLLHPRHSQSLHCVLIILLK